MTGKLRLILPSTPLECPVWPPHPHRVTSPAPGPHALGLRRKPVQGQAGAVAWWWGRCSGEGPGPGSPAELPPPAPPSAVPGHLALRPQLPARKPVSSHLVPAAGTLASGASVIGTGSRDGCSPDLDPPTHGRAEGWPSRGTAASGPSAALPPAAQLEWSRLKERGGGWKPSLPPFDCRPRASTGTHSRRPGPRPSIPAGRNRTGPRACPRGCAGLGSRFPLLPEIPAPHLRSRKPKPERTVPSRHPAFHPSAVKTNPNCRVHARGPRVQLSCYGSLVPSLKYQQIFKRKVVFFYPASLVP